MSWFWQICEAIRYTHAQNIIHRDLKLGNILLSDDMTIRLSDFGLSTLINNDSYSRALTKVGTDCYMAPEVLVGRTSGTEKAIDIWGLGCILYELLTWKFLYNKQTNLGWQILENSSEVTSMIKEAASSQKALKSILRLMLSKDPSSRPSIERILKKGCIKSYANVHKNLSKCTK